MRKGWIYILTNPDMPGLIKVGCSSNAPEHRARELDTTGVPSAFRVSYSLQIDEHTQWERKVHKALSQHHHRKEWFRCDLNIAISTIKELVGEAKLRELKNESSLSESEAFEAQLRKNYVIFNGGRERDIQIFRQELVKNIPEYYKSQEAKYLNDASTISILFRDGGWLKALNREKWTVLKSLPQLRFKEINEEDFVKQGKLAGRTAIIMLIRKITNQPDPRYHLDNDVVSTLAQDCLEINQTLHPVIRSILEILAKGKSWSWNSWSVQHSEPVVAARSRRNS